MLLTAVVSTADHEKAAMLSRKQLTGTMSSLWPNAEGWCTIEAAFDGVKTDLTEVAENHHIACTYLNEPDSWKQFDMGRELTVYKVRMIGNMASVSSI